MNYELLVREPRAQLERVFRHVGADPAAVNASTWAAMLAKFGKPERGWATVDVATYDALHGALYARPNAELAALLGDDAFLWRETREALVRARDEERVAAAAAAAAWTGSAEKQEEGVAPRAAGRERSVR